MSVPCVLLVGGLDPTGGAGVTADLLAAALSGARGRPVVAVLTAQGPGRPVEVRPVAPEILSLQLRSAAASVDVKALKTGALGSAVQVEAVASFVDGHGPGPVVVDPVINATAGGRLLDDDGVEALRGLLLPRALVVTPNLEEAGILASVRCVDRSGMLEAARAILAQGPGWVLVKGGHLEGDPADLLAGGSGERIWLEGPRVSVQRTHGTGCALASAIASYLARGMGVAESCRRARSFLVQALAASTAPAPDLVSLIAAGPRPWEESDS